MDDIEAIELILLKGSVSGGEFYREPTEDLFKDIRIGWVRECVESVVF